jgi:SAM-dependent methyltransferase
MGRGKCQPATSARAPRAGPTTIDAFARAEWGDRIATILDAAAGIGTQALGLAALGYRVTASDISAASIARARQEAANRGVALEFAVADMRSLTSVHAPHDLVLAWDNALPHLLTDDDIATALGEVFRCTTPGGGWMFSVRDYARESRDTPHGIRTGPNGRTAVFQVRDWVGDHHDLSMYMVEDLDGACTTHVARGGRYYAVTIDRLLALLRGAGFANVRRIDEPFGQPALVGTRPV